MAAAVVDVRQLETELDALLPTVPVVAAGRRGRGARRRRGAAAGLASAVLSWCERAAVHLFCDGDSPERRLVTECGRTLLRTLLDRLARHPDGLSAGMYVWMQETVLPVLCPPGEAVLAEPDLAAALIRVLVHAGATAGGTRSGETSRSGKRARREREAMAVIDVDAEEEQG